MIAAVVVVEEAAPVKLLHPLLMWFYVWLHGVPTHNCRCLHYYYGAASDLLAMVVSLATLSPN